MGGCGCGCSEADLKVEFTCDFTAKKITNFIPLLLGETQRNGKNKLGGSQTWQLLVQKLYGYYKRSQERGSQQSPACHTSISRNKKLWYLTQIVLRRQDFKYVWHLTALCHECLDKDTIY